MPKLSGRDWQLVVKALVVAVAAIERMPEGPFRPDNDVADMKALLDELVEADAALAHYARSARIALSGKPE
jgi:hypothetical protein